ncbi:MAG: hypothetical protein H6658_19975 [Ardenticatenaceae bacterium]|nr:hypothetical protein [Ardenticatenaceae bacterium]
MHTYTCDPALEISGQTLQAYIDNVQADIIEPIFHKHGMSVPDPEKWYPLQPVLDVLKEIHDNPDATTNLVAIGVKIAEYGVEPEDIIAAPLNVVFEHWEEHMYSSVRNGDAGRIITEKVNDKFYKITQQNIFPDDLCYGLAYGFARSRLPLGVNFRVWYEDYDNRIDNGGGDKTVICVQWE